MKIAIVGGGSMGLLYAFYLGKLFDVTIYTRTRQQAEVLNNKGVFLCIGCSLLNTSVNAQPVDKWYGGKEDLAIITVKQNQIPEVVEKIKAFSKDKSNYLFIQNGMGHIKWLGTLKADNIYLGVVEHGANRLDLNTVKHNGNGVTRVAVYRGNSNLLKTLSFSLKDTFPILIEENYLQMLHKKLIVNAVINPLTAILDVPNGALVNNPSYFQLLRELFEEIVQVLEITHKEDHFKNVINICSNTAQNHSSMLKDIKAKRVTEVDSILGYLINEGVRKNKSICLIRHYYDSIKGKELEREER